MIRSNGYNAIVVKLPAIVPANKCSVVDTLRPLDEELVVEVILLVSRSPRNMNELLFTANTARVAMTSATAFTHFYLHPLLCVQSAAGGWWMLLGTGR